ncbi:MAG: hypothetical protein ACRDOO_17115 [Actinomadura sp.]
MTIQYKVLAAMAIDHPTMIWDNSETFEFAELDSRTVTTVATKTTQMMSCLDRLSLRLIQLRSLIFSVGNWISLSISATASMNIRQPNHAAVSISKFVVVSIASPVNALAPLSAALGDMPSMTIFRRAGQLAAARTDGTAVQNETRPGSRSARRRAAVIAGTVR